MHLSVLDEYFFPQFGDIPHHAVSAPANAALAISAPDICKNICKNKTIGDFLQKLAECLPDCLPIHNPLYDI
uniref:Uncharacterized protein n=1 Tax=Romanomermis culicivorax TaxID=13658 RepID=A0A915IRG6_ROMCU